MVQSRDESPPSRHQLVVLACLSQKPPPGDIELGEVIQQFVSPRASVDAARQRAIEILKQLVQRAWVTGDETPAPRGRRQKAHRPRTLTDSGKRVLRDAFQLPRAPSWAKVRDRYLPAMGLGMQSMAELTGKSLDEETLMASVLGAQFGVRGASTLMSVCDALIANALGMQPGRLTLDRLRAHVILRGIDRNAPGIPDPGSKGYAAKAAAWVACNAVGASGAQRKMARALARRWACNEPPPDQGAAATGPAPQPKPTAMVPTLPHMQPSGLQSPGSQSSVSQSPISQPSITQLPLAHQSNAHQSNAHQHTPSPRTAPSTPGTAPTPTNLLDVVRETIPHVGAEGRFGEKVYVSAIWRSIERERKAGDLSLDNFKRWLVSANRDGWLVLARADLIGAMDARQVSESEIHDRGATFHFVLDQGGGAVAQRGSHAR